MALFGRAYRLDQGPVKLEEEIKRGGSERVRQIGGFMAPWTRKNLPRSLQVVGAGLQQIGDNRGQLSQFSANEAEQARYDAAMAVRQRSEKQQGAQQDMLEQAISQLPPDQQRLARLDPEGFVRALLQQQAQGQEWETNGTSPYRIGPDGNVIMGSGNIPHRPRAPLIQYGQAGDEQDWEYGE